MTESRWAHEMAMEEILVAVGYAVWQAQILERALAYHLVIVYGESDSVARAQAAQAFSVAEKRTLGTVLSAIKKAVPRDTDLFERLDAFRERRNWLVHHSRHDYPSAVHDDVAKAKLMTLLYDIAEAAPPLAKEVQDATDEHLISSGIRTREQLTVDARRILTSWRNPAD